MILLFERGRFCLEGLAPFSAGYSLLRNTNSILLSPPYKIHLSLLMKCDADAGIAECVSEGLP